MIKSRWERTKQDGRHKMRTQAEREQDRQAHDKLSWYWALLPIGLYMLMIFRVSDDPWPLILFLSGLGLAMWMIISLRNWMAGNTLDLSKRPVFLFFWWS